MRGLGNPGAARLLVWAGAIVLSMGAVPAQAQGALETVRAVRVVPRLEGFARVEPVSLLRVKAIRSGAVTDLKILPGETLAAGTVLARLTGPVVEASLAQSRGALAAARAALQAARETLAAARRKRAAHLNTQDDVFRAEASLAAARAGFDEAGSRLRAARAALALRSPVAGTVQSVAVASGEQVAAGETLLSLQPAGSLWLRAVYYGAEATALRVGMSGRFVPADGGTAVPVRVRSLIGVVAPDGGQAVGLKATGASPGWRSGEAGTVTLEGSERTMVAVPSRALILDSGRWWVLVHTRQGNRPQAVVPGPVRGASTLIESGLAAGAQIVVENAYLEFHRDFSRRYQPPD